MITASIKNTAQPIHWHDVIEIKSHISNIVKLMSEQSSNVDAEKAIIYRIMSLFNEEVIKDESIID